MVLLIDRDTGMIGLSWMDEETQKEKKLSFKVDLNRIKVFDALNEEIPFSAIAVGDHADLSTLEGQNQVETLAEIRDLTADSSDR